MKNDINKQDKIQKRLKELIAALNRLLDNYRESPNKNAEVLASKKVTISVMEESYAIIDELTTELAKWRMMNIDFVEAYRTLIQQNDKFPAMLMGDQVKIMEKFMAQQIKEYNSLIRLIRESNGSKETIKDKANG